jgi:hypothetical protein
MHMTHCYTANTSRRVGVTPRTTLTPRMIRRVGASEVVGVTVQSRVPPYCGDVMVTVLSNTWLQRDEHAGGHFGWHPYYALLQELAHVTAPLLG